MTEYAEIFFDSLIIQTEEAVLLETSEGNKWIPKSLIEDEEIVDYNSELLVNIEAWFAKKQGLI